MGEFENLYQQEVTDKEQEAQDQNLVKVLEEVRELTDANENNDDIDIAQFLGPKLENNLQTIDEGYKNVMVQELNRIKNNDTKLDNGIIQQINHLISLLAPTQTEIAGNERKIDRNQDLSFDNMYFSLHDYRDKINNICKIIDKFTTDDTNHNTLNGNLKEIKNKIQNTNEKITDNDCLIIIQFLQQFGINDKGSSTNNADKMINMLEKFSDNLNTYLSNTKDYNDTINYYQEQFNEWKEDFDEFSKIIKDGDIWNLNLKISQKELTNVQNYISHKHNTDAVMNLYKEMHKIQNALPSRTGSRDKERFNTILQTIEQNYASEITENTINNIETIIKRRSNSLIEFFAEKNNNWNGSSEAINKNIIEATITELFPSVELSNEGRQMLTNRFIERNEERISDNVISLINYDITDVIKNNERDNFYINNEGVLNIESEEPGFTYKTIKERIITKIKENTTNFNFLNNNEIDIFCEDIPELYLSPLSYHAALGDSKYEIAIARENTLRKSFIEKSKQIHPDQALNIEHPEIFETEKIILTNLKGKLNKNPEQSISEIKNFLNDIHTKGVTDGGCCNVIRSYIVRLEKGLTIPRKKSENNTAYSEMKSLQKSLNSYIKENKNDLTNQEIDEDGMFGHETFGALKDVINDIIRKSREKHPELTPNTLQQTQEQISELKSNIINIITNETKEIPGKEKIKEIIQSGKEDDIKYLQLVLIPKYTGKIDGKISQNLRNAINKYSQNEWTEGELSNNTILPLSEGYGFYNLDENHKDESFVSVDHNDYSNEAIAYFADGSEFRYKAINLQGEGATQKIKYVGRYEDQNGNIKTLTLDPNDLSANYNQNNKYSFNEKEYNRFKIFNNKFLEKYKEKLKKEPE